jgi:hypothetical protein
LDSEVLTYVAASENLYRNMETGVIVMSRVDDPLAGPVVHVGSTVLKPTSAFAAYGQLAIAALWGLSIVISIPYALVWGVRRLRGKIPHGPAIRIRVWPLLAGLSVIAFIMLFSAGMGDPFSSLGKPCAWPDHLDQGAGHRNESRQLLVHDHELIIALHHRRVSRVVRHHRPHDLGLTETALRACDAYRSS